MVGRKTRVVGDGRDPPEGRRSRGRVRWSGYPAGADDGPLIHHRHGGTDAQGRPGESFLAASPAGGRRRAVKCPPAGKRTPKKRAPLPRGGHSGGPTTPPARTARLNCGRRRGRTCGVGLTRRHGGFREPADAAGPIESAGYPAPRMGVDRAGRSRTRLQRCPSPTRKNPGALGHRRRARAEELGFLTTSWGAAATRTAFPMTALEGGGPGIQPPDGGWVRSSPGVRWGGGRSFGAVRLLIRPPGRGGLPAARRLAASTVVSLVPALQREAPGGGQACSTARRFTRVQGIGPGRGRRQDTRLYSDTRGRRSADEVGDACGNKGDKDGMQAAALALGWSSRLAGTVGPGSRYYWGPVGWKLEGTAANTGFH